MKRAVHLYKIQTFKYLEFAVNVFKPNSIGAASYVLMQLLLLFLRVSAAIAV